MAKACQLSKKQYNRANKICFSNKKHRHKQDANLQSKRVWLAEEGRWVRVLVSTKALKTITRYGLRSAMKRYGVTSL